MPPVPPLQPAENPLLRTSRGARAESMESYREILASCGFGEIVEEDVTPVLLEVFGKIEKKLIAANILLSLTGEPDPLRQVGAVDACVREGRALVMDGTIRYGLIIARRL